MKTLVSALKEIRKSAMDHPCFDADCFERRDIDGLCAQGSDICDWTMVAIQADDALRHNEKIIPPHNAATVRCIDDTIAVLVARLKAKQPMYQPDAEWNALMQTCESLRTAKQDIVRYVAFNEKLSHSALIDSDYESERIRKSMLCEYCDQGWRDGMGALPHPTPCPKCNEDGRVPRSPNDRRPQRYDNTKSAQAGSIQ